MLPPFILTATLDGEYTEFVACDVPTGVFFGDDFQEVMPGMACFGKEAADAQRAMLTRMEAWSDAMLTRVIADPVLTLEDLRYFGSARDELVLGYLWAIGWETPKDALQRVSPRIATDGAYQAPAPSLDALRAIPSPNMKKAVRELAAKGRTDPDTVLAEWPVSKFIRNWRLIMQDELLKKGGGGSLGQSDLVDTIGREAA